MSKVLVLYYSSYGHLETMAQAIAEGARGTGATVDVKRVPETVPEDIARSAHFKLEQAAPVATVAELAAGADVPPSALMRFCQIMGFSGFSEMQKLFREAYAPGWPDYSTRLQHLREMQEGTPSALLAEFVEAGRMSLENLVKTVDPQAMEVAVIRCGGVGQGGQAAPCREPGRVMEGSESPGAMARFCCTG